MVTLVVSSGVVSSGLTVGSQGELDVDAGGVAIDTTVLNGGSETVFAGGAENGGIVSSGGSLEDSGLVSGETIGLGGRIEVLSGGQLDASIVSSGGTLFLSGGGASGDIVMSGGTASAPMTIQSGKTFTYEGPTVVAPLQLGGVLLESGAKLSLTSVTISPDATLSLGAGSVLDQLITIDAGGLLVGPGHAAFIHDYGEVKGIVLERAPESGFVGLIVWKEGIAAADSIVSGGDEFIEGGGRAYNEHVMSGGLQAMDNGRVVSTTVAAGGEQRVAHRVSLAVHTIVAGVETLFDAGMSDDSLVESGGVEFVSSASVATDTTVYAAGRVIVTKGGALVDSLLAGGLLEVSSGGLVSGGLTIKGGQAMIDGTLSGGAAFTGSAGYLRIDNVAAFHGAISGLTTSRQLIDLGKLGFAKGETATWSQTGGSGALKVVDGAQSASLTLVGGYATSDFALSNDGRGGTLLTLVSAPTAAASDQAPARFAEAMGGFADGRDSAGPGWVHSGGAVLASAAVVTPHEATEGFRSA
jgi:autotransporter passenger strand-loop-strand repeat protein